MRTVTSSGLLTLLVPLPPLKELKKSFLKAPCTGVEVVFEVVLEVEFVAAPREAKKLLVLWGWLSGRT
jgi:hypothetical protein